MTSRVAPEARLLGYAGLLPQIAAIVMLAGGNLVVARLGAMLAFGYGALILSFLGGIWWGFAVKREGGQTPLLVAAVLPSLVALALGIGATVRGDMGRSLVGLGLAILLTLMVERRLVESGEAPAGWMALRMPLSVGLGVLTIVAGVLAW